MVGDAGVGNDQVEESDIVSCLEGRNCGGGGGVVFVVDFDDDEACVGGFGNVLEVLAGGRIAYTGYDCVIWAGEVGFQETIADSSIRTSDQDIGCGCHIDRYSNLMQRNWTLNV